MPLANLHLLDPATAYLVERSNFLKQAENDPLFQHRLANPVPQ